jgi:hypothetical protein
MPDQTRVKDPDQKSSIAADPIGWSRLVTASADDDKALLGSRPQLPWTTRFLRARKDNPEAGSSEESKVHTSSQKRA